MCRFVERMIAPPAVERWAENVIKRTMASYVQAWAMLREAREFLAQDDGRKAEVNHMDQNSRFATLAHRNHVALCEALGGFICAPAVSAAKLDLHTTVVTPRANVTKEEVVEVQATDRRLFGELGRQSVRTVRFHPRELDDVANRIELLECPKREDVLSRPASHSFGVPDGIAAENAGLFFLRYKHQPVGHGLAARFTCGLAQRALSKERR
ncbi:hypothetical protein NKI56_34340 [Mesorhizobium sp. M0622]|uniref:hypothetical protein n=1 Tax=Mesorhizobium sp. M0622 TaxID=2956975 RepID=UPI00333D56EB